MKRSKDAHNGFIGKINQSFSKNDYSDPSPKLEKMMDGFKQDLSAHPVLNESPKGYRENNSKINEILSKIPRPIMLTCGSGLAGLILVSLMVFINFTPTWADIEKQFGIIKGFSLSIYYRNHIDQRPAFAQFWSNKNGQKRVHTGNHVVFINNETGVQAFNVETRTKGKAFGVIFFPLRMIQRANDNGKTSLKFLINTLSGEDMIDTTDLVISDSQVAEDLLVFDTTSRDTLWKLRIWVLKETQLPIRILKQHLKDGRFIDMQFTYSKDQPENFYDADAFSAELGNHELSRFELMNRFLQDPGTKGFFKSDG